METEAKQTSSTMETNREESNQIHREKKKEIIII
jgi:hypothetical protein